MMGEKDNVAVGVRQTAPRLQPQAACGLLHAFAAKTIRRHGEILANEADFSHSTKLFAPNGIRLGGGAADAMLEMHGRHGLPRLRQQQKQRRAVRPAAEANEYAAMHILPLEEVMHELK